MIPVHIIGMGLSPDDLTAHHRRLIENAEILVGGARHLAHFAESTADKKEITKDIQALIDYVQERMHTRRIVVLASGDPLYYGIGAHLADALGPQKVEIHPNVSSVAAAFARIKTSWSDAVVVSLHGRKNEPSLVDALKSTDKVAVLTDSRHTPAWLVEFCRENGFGDFELGVFEELGSASERIRWIRPGDESPGQFKEPNLVILLRRENDGQAPHRYHLGLPEEFFLHQRGLITKAEIRAVTLSKLALSTEHVFWDLGAGSGSVAVEAALFVKNGRIIAVEKDAQRSMQIRRNLERFSIENATVVQDAFPACLAGLPRPHRVFIGGGGNILSELITAVDRRVRPRARIVMNTVLMANLDGAVKTLESLGYRTDIVQIQISRSRAMPWSSRLEAENPVWIISGERRT